MTYSKTKKIMWTEVTITLFWETHPDTDSENIFDIFHSLELEFSRFLPDSSLSILNKNRTSEVSERFIDILKKCKEIYTDTQWYFNPLINLSQIGYSKDFHSNEFIKQEPIKVNLDLEKVEINWNQIILQEGQNLDFGGIVKWYAVDRAKEYVDQKWYKNYIIDAWGDIYTAWLNEDWTKILVGIDSPFIKDNIFATLEVENKAIATSGTYKRKWQINSQEYNHIINPIQSNNNNEIISITLIADDCYLADAYATSCIAMWVEKALAFLEKNQIDGVIICTDETVHITDEMQKYNLEII